MTFARDLSKAIEKAKDKAELAARKITIELFSNVILKSPVDTGRFRANWNCSIGSVDKSTSEETDKSGAGSIGRVRAEVTKYTLDGRSIYLANSLPYADRLENGWSDQAPQGMVRLSIIETNNAISNV